MMLGLSVGLLGDFMTDPVASTPSGRGDTDTMGLALRGALAGEPLGWTTERVEGRRLCFIDTPMADGGGGEGEDEGEGETAGIEDTPTEAAAAAAADAVDVAAMEVTVGFLDVWSSSSVSSSSSSSLTCESRIAISLASASALLVVALPVGVRSTLWLRGLSLTGGAVAFGIGMGADGCIDEPAELDDGREASDVMEPARCR